MRLLLSRLTHIAAPSTSLFLRIAHLSYFLLPPTSQALTTMKQCLHYDPDSKPPCAKLHRELKKLDKTFDKLSSLLESGNFRGIVKLADASKDDAFHQAFESAMDHAISVTPLPEGINFKQTSERRRAILQALCKSHTQLKQPKRGELPCDALYNMEGGENETDALVARGESLLVKEAWEEAVRVFEKAFKTTGKSCQGLYLGCRELRDC
jgi:DnaJ homolog subfamily C member 3